VNIALNDIGHDLSDTRAVGGWLFSIAQRKVVGRDPTLPRTCGRVLLR
jgi:hypothetical protein